MDALEGIVRETYGKIPGLELSEVTADCFITRAVRKREGRQEPGGLRQTGHHQGRDEVTEERRSSPDQARAAAPSPRTSEISFYEVGQTGAEEGPELLAPRP